MEITTNKHAKMPESGRTSYRLNVLKAGASCIEKCHGLSLLKTDLFRYVYGKQVPDLRFRPSAFQLNFYLRAYMRVV